MLLRKADNTDDGWVEVEKEMSKDPGANAMSLNHAECIRNRYYLA